MKPGPDRSSGTGRCRPTVPGTLLLCTLLASSCSSEATGPAASPVRLVVAEGDGQFVLPGGTALEPLGVQAVDPTSGRPMTDITVTWRVVGGAGASLESATTTTGETGVAEAVVHAGPAAGTYRFEATAARLVGAAPTFELRAVPAPVTASIAPAPVTGGGMVTVEGSGFTGTAEEHRILFGGLRGTIVSVTPTRITARAPSCLLTRTSDVRVTLGAVTSNALVVETLAGDAAALSLSPGERTTVRESSALECMAIEGVPAGSRFLLITQNATRAAAAPLRYELNAIAAGGTPAVLESPTFGAHRDAASDFELALRRSERRLGPAVLSRQPGDEVAAARTVPAIGERREFNVLTAGGGTRRITATVQALSGQAIMYVDDEAPEDGLSAADLAYFGGLFDDPIHETATAVFGEPSDIDANDRIVILFTPAVNALTENEASGFIAGYFYGCDLVAVSRCSATNRGEIFYSMVPDPAGVFGGSRSRETVRRTVPAVLAHEFQHMISFARKDDRLDVLWLSEGLAHAAEDLIGDVLEQRGDIINALTFRRPNYARAQLYLRRTAETALVAEDSPGTLEQRGGAWLLVAYMAGHFGGNDLLGRLTSSAAIGADNIEQSTGQPWHAVFAGFTTALWADGAPGLAGPLAATSTFSNLDLRDIMASLGGPYPLSPPSVQFQDFQLSDALPSGSQDYLLIDVPSATATLRLGLTGLVGGPFSPGTTAQLTVLRIR